MFLFLASKRPKMFRFRKKQTKKNGDWVKIMNIENISFFIFFDAFPQSTCQRSSSTDLSQKRYFIFTAKTELKIVWPELDHREISPVNNLTNSEF